MKEAFRRLREKFKITCNISKIDSQVKEFRELNIDLRQWVYCQFISSTFRFMPQSANLLRHGSGYKSHMLSATHFKIRRAALANKHLTVSYEALLRLRSTKEVYRLLHSLQPRQSFPQSTARLAESNEHQKTYIKSLPEHGSIL